jgi:RNA polymerase sigma-70 factor, ECF subfamily
MTGDDERTLVEAVARRGDERAFAVLYEKHASLMFGLALRLTGSHDDAQDVAHDAWVRAIDRLDRFEWRAALSTWLCGFVVRRAREFLRERDRGAPPPHDDAGPALDDRRLTGTFDRVELEHAIAGLAHGYREVLLLHDVYGYTHREIGSMLGVEAGTSKSQLSRARRALRLALDAKERT